MPWQVRRQPDAPETCAKVARALLPDALKQRFHPERIRKEKRTHDASEVAF